uniref:Choline transporter-like protein n=1 Tax=Iconisemion striatum TaxID=60296 RepID=A0A1A7YPK5_9TELE
MARVRNIPPSQYGEPLKFDLRGPVHNRKCTDVACCIIFVTVILGYIALGTVAWIHGDPRKIVYPTDSQGQFCGQQNTSNANKAILFYFNMLKCANPVVLINLQCPTTQLCVSKCPDRFATLMDVSSTNNWDYYKQFCKPGFKTGIKSVADVIRDEDCPSMIVPSKPFFQRCFPEFNTKDGILRVANQTTFKDGDNNKRNVIDLRDAANSMGSLLNAKEVGINILEDFANSWMLILLGLAVAMLVSVLYIILLRYIGGVIVCLSLCGVITAVGYGIWSCYGKYSSLCKKPYDTISDIGFQTDLSIYLEYRQTWLIFLTLLIMVETTLVILMIFLGTRLSIPITLLKEGSRAISHIMSTLFYPLITFLLLAICVSYSAVTAVFLASSGEAVYKVTAADDQCVYANLTCSLMTFNQTNVTKVCPGAQCMFAFYGGESVYHQYILVLHLCNLFVVLWLVNFIFALGQCTLAGAFASYYWAPRKPKDIPPFPLYSSFSRAIRYHTGSLAFGSLILAWVQVVRVVLTYLDHKLKGSQNCVARFLVCCLRCCFWSLERFIKFLNKNAYIMIAIYGKNFCTSSKDAFSLLMRNILRVATLDCITWFLLFIGKLFIAGVASILTLVFLRLFQEFLPTVNYISVPIVMVIIGSYMIANGFFNVFCTCVETLFLCFCEDLERNDGSSSRPYYISPDLHKILRKGEERAKSCASS